MTTWSHSRLEAYENCPRQFKYRYIDEIEPETESMHAFMGKRVQEILEDLYKSVHVGKTLPLEELLKRYDDAWEPAKEKPLSLPDKMTEDDFRHLGRRCIENYYRRYDPFNQDTTIGIEEKIWIDLQDAAGRIHIVGFLDRISRGPDGVVRIHDYKTGKMKSQRDLDSDRQLALYQIGLKQRWPEMECFELVWHYVAYNEELKSHRSPEQLEALKTEIAALVRMIESDTIFEPRKSALCNYCDYQSICPLWKPLYDLNAMPASERAVVPVVQLVDRYGELINAKKMVEAEIEELKRQLVEQLSDEPKQALFGTRWRVNVSRTEGIRIPKKGKPERGELEEILKSAGLWEHMVALDTAAFKKWVAAKLLDEKLTAVVEPLIRREISHRFSLWERSPDDLFGNED